MSVPFLFLSCLFSLSLFCLSPSFVAGDAYMHFMRGSNDRLNEASRERNNANRLFDSQNNGRGGVNVGTDGKPYYYAGTTVPMQFSLQHSCGEPGRMQCTIIWQYACDVNMRDGTTTNTIPYGVQGSQQCANGYCDTDPQYGRHESYASYRSCLATRRNNGIFTADQQVGGSAVNTRQNPGGNRFGYECTEERDYYPYWRPSMWRDIAIMTDVPDKCAAYQAESQNVKPRSYCQVPQSYLTQNQITDDSSQYIPYDPVGCGNIKGAQWVTQPAFNIAPPQCIPNFRLRDNHHGGVDQSAYPGVYSWPTFNWTLPDGTANTLIGENCVVRLRYNMSTTELGANYGFASPSSVQVDPFVTSNQNQVQNSGNQYSLLDVHSPYNLNFTEAVNRGYTFYNNPTVDIFGFTGALSGAVSLTLAINTAQYGRTFQDRSHVFAIRPRPESLQGVSITNIGVRGRRGNIVQTYPSLEYDFVPEIAYVNRGDYIHFQWEGSATNEADDDPNNNNNGPAATDHSNVVPIRVKDYSEYGQAIRDKTENVIGQYGNYYPGLINDTTLYPFLGWSFEDRKTLGIFALNLTYFDLGPRQVTSGAGTYYYLSTRNNNFSNRNQAAAIVVMDPNPLAPITPSTYNPDAAMVGGDGAVVMQYAPDGTPASSSIISVTETSGPGGMSSSWLMVEPMGPIAVVPGMTVTLNILTKQQALTSGVMYWASDNMGTNMTVVPTYTSDYGTTSASINQGGYYAVQNQLNAGAVAGIVIAILFVFAVVGFLYWKVRIQPIGGCGPWFNQLRNGSKAGEPAGAPNTSMRIV